MRNRHTEREDWKDNSVLGEKEIVLAKALGAHYPELIQTQKNPSAFKMAVSILHRDGLLNTNLLDIAFKHHYPDVMARGIVILNELGLLADYCECIANNLEPDAVAEALEFLLKFDLLDARNRDLVATSSVPRKMAIFLQLLDQMQLTFLEGIHKDNLDLIAQLMIFFENDKNYNRRNFYILKNVSTEVLNKLLSFVCELNNSNFINQTNFNVIIGYGTNIDRLIHSIRRLKSAHIFEQTTFDLIINSPEPRRMVNAMLTLHEHQLLTYEIKKNLATSDISQIDIFMTCLEQEQLLTHENLEMLLPLRPNLASVSFSLQQANILNQGNIEALNLDVHSVLLTEEAQFLFWNRLPFHRITQGFFNDLLALARQNLSVEVFIIIANEMIEELDNEFLEFDEPEEPVFNHAQSTHIQSVESSITESIQKLVSTYLHTFELEQMIQEIKNFIKDLNPGFKNDAAKRCIKRITANDYAFIHSDTGISIRQCLTLVYVAIHDTPRCHASLENAKSLLIEALYEIQRGYNINSHEVDNRTQDKPICPGGTFNKLIEKLWAIHTLCPISYVNNSTVTFKLHRVINAVSVELLLSKTPIKDLDAFIAFYDLMCEMIQDGVDVIWEELQPKVSRIMHQEFNGFAGLDNIIDNGRYFNQLSDSRLQQQIDFIHAARQSNEVLNDLNQHYFWSNRHISPKAQMHFDKQYGLLNLSIHNGISI